MPIPNPDVQQLMEVLAEIANASMEYGLVECTVNGRPSVALVRKRDETDDSIDLDPIMVAITPNLKVEPKQGGQLAFPVYSLLN